MGSRLRIRFPHMIARLTRQLPLRAVPGLERPPPAAPAGLIPNMVYQTWRAPLFGRDHAAALQRFRDLNPDYGFAFYDEEGMDAYMAAHWGDHPIHAIFKAGRFGPLRTDIWRYCVLFDRGGVYCDIGKAAAVPLRELIPADADGVVTFEANAYVPENAPPAVLHPDRVVVNYILMFAAGHPLLRRVIDRIVAKYPLYRGRAVPDPKHAILRFTGPHHLTECLHAEIAANGTGRLHQAEIDFGGRLLGVLPGAWVRYVDQDAYMLARDQAIVG